jgi:GMP synthase-like glutamine amidotransferase
LSVKPILVIDAYLDPRGGAHNYLPRLADREVQVAAVAHGPCPTSAAGYSAIFISGSGASVVDPAPWVGTAAALVRDAAAERVPVLGVCFGHQLIPYALWGAGSVRRTATPELGWCAIERTRDDALLAGFSNEFTAFESHRDEVVAGLGALEVLARNEACAVQAFQVRDHPLWGVQFHPEMGLEEIEALIVERAGEPQGADFDAAALLQAKRDTRELGDRLFANFLALAGLE